MKHRYYLASNGTPLLRTNNLAAALNRIAKEIALGDDPRDLELWVRAERAIRGCNEYEVLFLGGTHNGFEPTFKKARARTRKVGGEIWARLPLVVETSITAELASPWSAVGYAGETGRKTKRVRT